ncbi:hypothetical protein NHX12_029163 [Muraenolepis orangiensis]|uniref:Receptor ligand binding region domain-containing protein n=1 Tax=Muraenolepis orangiensis TaxID=630683 RepID=A0A9Q0IKX5_9TELE|nr:hypothetical protein NHX12_029163 [Muraenolepis orangiensis]
MACFIILSFLLLLKPVRTASITEEVEVLVILPKNNSYIFSYPRVVPAIQYAQQRLRASGQYSGLTFKIQYVDSECGNPALFNLVDRSCDQRPDLILGPVCEYAAASVARLASHWNIPMVTAGALAAAFSHKGTEYSHLTRVAPSYLKMAETFAAMFQHFAWKSALLVYEDDKEERTCHFTLEGVFMLLDHVKTYTVTSREERLDTDDLLHGIYETEAFLLCNASTPECREENPASPVRLVRPEGASPRGEAVWRRCVGRRPRWSMTRFNSPDRRVKRQQHQRDPSRRGPLEEGRAARATHVTTDAECRPFSGQRLARARG